MLPQRARNAPGRGRESARLLTTDNTGRGQATKHISTGAAEAPEADAPAPAEGATLERAASAETEATEAPVGVPAAEGSVRASRTSIMPSAAGRRPLSARDANSRPASRQSIAPTAAAAKTAPKSGIPAPRASGRVAAKKP